MVRHDRRPTCVDTTYYLLAYLERPVRRFSYALRLTLSTQPFIGLCRHGYMMLCYVFRLDWRMVVCQQTPRRNRTLSRCKIGRASCRDSAPMKAAAGVLEAILCH